MRKLILLLALSACGGSAQPSPKNLSPIETVNKTFHGDYDRFRDAEEASIRASRPFIIYDGPSVTLRYHGKELKRRLWITPYQNIKGLTHATVGILATLSVMQDRDKEHLRVVDAQLAEVDRNVASAVRPELVDAEHRIIAASRQLLAEAIAHGKPTDDRIRQYGLSIREDLIANLIAGSGVLVETLHAAVMDMKAEVDPADWAKLVVLVTTAHQARAREIGVQYFERLVGDHMAEGASGEQRMVVTEGAYKGGVPEARMAAHLVDQRIGVLLFDDPYFMQRDVMGKFVGTHLDRLFPPQTATKSGGQSGAAE